MPPFAVRRTGWAPLVPAAVVALALYAWVASPQGDGGVLERAADALEEAGTASVRTEVDGAGAPQPFVTRFVVDFHRDLVVVEDPEPGVARRLVTPAAVYDQLADGTWLHLLEGAPPLFGQDVVTQLRGIDATVQEVGRRQYRVRYRQLGADSVGRLVLDEHDVPVLFASTYEVGGRTIRLSWRVVETGVVVDVDPPDDARPVTTEERAALLDATR